MTSPQTRWAPSPHLGRGDTGLSRDPNPLTPPRSPSGRGGAPSAGHGHGSHCCCVGRRRVRKLGGLPLPIWGEGGGEGDTGLWREPNPLTPPLSPVEVGFIRLRPLYSAELGQARVRRGRGSRPSTLHDHGFHCYTVSINMAPPWPPPMHSVAMPCLMPSRFIAFTRCSTMRLPLAPTGWPRPIAPPSTFSLSRGIRPAAPGSPSTSRQKVSSSQAARHPSTCAANASLSSHSPMSLSARECRRRIAVAHSTGPSPMIEGSSADHSLSTITARGVSLCFSTASSDARITQEAPSVICEELPAVTLPHGRSNAGLSLARVSTVVSGRTPSS